MNKIKYKKNKKITKENEFKNLSFNERMCLVKKEIKFIQKKGIGLFSQKSIQLTDILDRLLPILSKYGIYNDESFKIENIDFNARQFWGYITITKYDAYSDYKVSTIHSYIGKAQSLKRGLENINFTQGKASTYGRKYAYLESFGIGTNERDPDFEKDPEDYHEKKSSKEKLNEAKDFINQQKTVKEKFGKIIKPTIKNVEDIPQEHKDKAERERNDELDW